MISKITMFGFKSGVGYQLDRHDEKLFERYLLCAKKLEENKHKQETEDYREAVQRRIEIKK